MPEHISRGGRVLSIPPPDEKKEKTNIFGSILGVFWEGFGGYLEVFGGGFWRVFVGVFEKFLGLI